MNRLPWDFCSYNQDGYCAHFSCCCCCKELEFASDGCAKCVLHGDLDEEVYFKMLPGFASSSSRKVCKLRKSLYGLRQVPRCWFAKLAKSLKKFGFQQSSYDYPLFTFRDGIVQMNILVYVDDLIISGTNEVVVQRFKDYLNQCFHMKDLGKLKYFLGIEVARNSEGLFFCQQKYALDIVRNLRLI